MLEAGGVPEEHEVVDNARHRGGAGDGSGGLVLGILEVEELLLVVKRDLKWPSILHP
jgi:hypothetical protein